VTSTWHSKIQAWALKYLCLFQTMKILFTIASAIENEFLIVELLITSKWPLVYPCWVDPLRMSHCLFYWAIKLFRNIENIENEIFSWNSLLSALTKLYNLWNLIKNLLYLDFLITAFRIVFKHAIMFGFFKLLHQEHEFGTHSGWKN
jgi:hypothetical protein